MQYRFLRGRRRGRSQMSSCARLGWVCYDTCLGTLNKKRITEQRRYQDLGHRSEGGILHMAGHDGVKTPRLQSVHLT